MVCAAVLMGRSRSIRSVARDSGVADSSLRYRHHRAAGAIDGRKGKAEGCDEVAGVFAAWIERRHAVLAVKDAMNPDRFTNAQDRLRRPGKRASTGRYSNLVTITGDNRLGESAVASSRRGRLHVARPPSRRMR